MRGELDGVDARVRVVDWPSETKPRLVSESRRFFDFVESLNGSGGLSRVIGLDYDSEMLAFLASAADHLLLSCNDFVDACSDRFILVSSQLFRASLWIGPV